MEFYSSVCRPGKSLNFEVMGNEHNCIKTCFGLLLRVRGKQKFGLIYQQIARFPYILIFQRSSIREYYFVL